MIPHFSPLKLALLLLAVGLSSATAQPSREVVECVSPAKLLAAFPTVPETWKCEESRASTDVSVMGVPITTAVRRYQIPMETPPGNTPAEPVPVPPTIRIIAMDLGSREADSGLRSLPREKTYPLPGLTGEIKSYTERFIYEGIGQTRLIVQVEARRMSDAVFRQLLKKLPLEKLIALENTFPKNAIPAERQNTILNEKNVTLVVRKMTNIIVDELEPSKNRSWQSTTVDQLP